MILSNTTKLIQIQVENVVAAKGIPYMQELIEEHDLYELGEPLGALPILRLHSEAILEKLFASFNAGKMGNPAEYSNIVPRNLSLECYRVMYGLTVRTPVPPTPAPTPTALMVTNNASRQIAVPSRDIDAPTRELVIPQPEIPMKRVDDKPKTNNGQTPTQQMSGKKPGNTGKKPDLKVVSSQPAPKKLAAPAPAPVAPVAPVKPVEPVQPATAAPVAQDAKVDKRKSKRERRAAAKAAQATALPTNKTPPVATPAPTPASTPKPEATPAPVDGFGKNYWKDKAPTTAKPGVSKPIGAPNAPAPTKKPDNNKGKPPQAAQVATAPSVKPPEPTKAPMHHPAAGALSITKLVAKFSRPDAGARPRLPEPAINITNTVLAAVPVVSASMKNGLPEMTDRKANYPAKKNKKNKGRK